MRITAYALSDISVGVGARIGKICQAAVGRACKVFLSSTGGWGGQDASGGNDAARGMAEVTSRRRHQAGLPSSRVNRVSWLTICSTTLSNTYQPGWQTARHFLHCDQGTGPKETTTTMERLHSTALGIRAARRESDLFGLAEIPKPRSQWGLSRTI